MISHRKLTSKHPIFKQKLSFQSPPSTINVKLVGSRRRRRRLLRVSLAAMTSKLYPSRAVADATHRSSFIQERLKRPKEILPVTYARIQLIWWWVRPNTYTATSKDKSSYHFADGAARRADLPTQGNFGHFAARVSDGFTYTTLRSGF